MVDVEGGSGFKLTIRGEAREPGAERALVDGLACLSRGHERIESADLLANSTFELTATGLEPATYYLTLFVEGHASFRRRFHLADASVDESLGTLELASVEYPPGVRGLLWDAGADQPIATGVVRLEQDGAVLDEATPGDDGMFGFEMTCHRPMPPGEYELVAQATGYSTTRFSITIVDERTDYMVGRVELWNDAASV